eukprot:TRINITY_DN11952_c0_g1_i1.p1 TRINITY_DN11952_c0_g1~~TRINITY_DN11952_c0_g1_i1.p1  ORF type:complete len:181 (+),score=60.01 TRINITY_DN11952_c0_g1_i1:44-586(+)
MMVSRQFWKLLESCGLFSPSFTLAHFNRIYLKGKKSFFSLKYNPLDDQKDGEWRPITANSVTSPKDKKVEEKIAEAKIEDSVITPVKTAENGENSPITDILQDVQKSKSRINYDINEDEEMSIEELNPSEKIDVHDPLRPLLFRHFAEGITRAAHLFYICLLYTSPSPRDQRGSRMPSSA